jgi:trimeric autotransporter adhesin
MKRIVLLITTIIFSVVLLKAQQGVGVTNPHASSALEISSTVKGLLIPRMTTAQMNAVSSPANGLMIYNTTDGCVYVYRTSVWLSTCSATYAMAWGLLGNGGTTAGTNFIGTTDAVDFVTRTNNTEKMRVTSAGNVGIGTTAPNAALQLGNITTNRRIVMWEDGNNDHQYYGLGINSGMLRYQVSAPSASHAFYAGTSATTSNELMRITGTGNVGINTTTPQYKLDIDAQTGSSGNPLRLLGLNAGATSDSIISSNSGILRRLSINQILANAWTITGNAGTVDGTNFIGTTDNIPLSIRVNNQKAGRIDHLLNNAFWGYQSGNGSTTGQRNTGLGTFALGAVTTSTDNTAVGYNALATYTSSGAGGNTAIGSQALQANTSGEYNTAVGFRASNLNTTGLYNTTVGHASMQNNLSGSSNSALGYKTLIDNTTGAANTAVGGSALYTNTTGNHNTAVGYNALNLNLSGSDNIAIGGAAMLNNATGYSNAAIGRVSLNFNTTGYQNAAIGQLSLYNNTTGFNNVGVGYQAGSTITTGSNNIAIGNAAQVPTATANNQLSIGNWIYGNGGLIGIGTSTPQYKLDIDAQTGSSGNPLRLLGLNAGATSDSIVSSSSGILRRLSINQVLANAWNITGNAGTINGTNFIGTTDNVPFNIRVNNQKAARIASDGATYFGYQAGNVDANTSNTFIGYQSGLVNTGGQNNVAVGGFSLLSNTNGTNNIAVGGAALYANTTGYYNTAVGSGTMGTNTTGGFNSAFGREALFSNVTGNFNVAIGEGALYNSTTANRNTAVGTSALYGNSTGSSNTAVGVNALSSNGVGAFNTGVGEDALKYSNTNSTALGYRAGFLTSGNVNCTFIGYQADIISMGLTNATAIGANAKVDQSNTLILGGTRANAVNVGINTLYPQYKLDIDAQTASAGNPLRLQGLNAGATSDSIISSASGVLRRLSINQVLSNAWNINGNAGTNPATNFIGTTDAQALAFRTANTEWMRLNTTGSLGIGTTAPVYKLTVEEPGGFNADIAARLYNTNNLTYKPSLQLQASGGTRAAPTAVANNTPLGAIMWGGYDGAAFNDIQAAEINARSTEAWSTTAHGSALSFKTIPNTTLTSLTRMTIEQNGNVGIGTTTPQYNLDINGTALLRNGNSIGVYTNNQLLFGWAGSNTYMHALKTRHSSSTTFDNAIDFYLWKFGTDAAGSVGTQQVMTLQGNNNGSVGIGTTAPQYKLDIDAQTGSSGNPLRLLGLNQGAAGDSVLTSLSGIVRRRSVAEILGSSAWSTTGNAGTTAGTNFVGTTDNVGLHFKTNNTLRFFIQNGGQAQFDHHLSIPIATSTVGSAFGLSPNYLYLSEFVAPTGGNRLLNYGLGFYTPSSGELTTYLAGFYGTDFFANSALAMRLTRYGNLGIGTPTPNAALQLGNIVSNRRMVMWETANNDHQYYGFGINNGMLRYQVDGTGASHAFFAGTSSTTSNELMRITGTGNVGIGTNNPTNKLEVVTTTAYGGITLKGGTPSSGLELGILNDANNGYSIGVRGSTNTGAGAGIGQFYIHNRTLGYDALSIIPSNNFTGINMSNRDPAYQLDVYSVGNPLRLLGLNQGAAGDSILTSLSGVVRRRSVAEILGSGSGWSITGNSSTVDGTNFLGTTDDIPFNIRVNNQKAGRIDRTLQNTFFGYQVGNVNSAANNSFIGYISGAANTTGDRNTFVGSLSGASNTTGTENTAIGHQSLNSNTTGYDNTALGEEALRSNTTGIGNTATGESCLEYNTTASFNTANGYEAMFLNTIGISNVAMGYRALTANTTASRNIAIGHDAINNQSFSNGGVEWESDNIGIGYRSLQSNQPTNTSNGYRNVGIGTRTLDNNTTGATNVAVGYEAGNNNTTGSNNTFLGYQANVASNSLNNATAIGNGATVSSSNRIRLGNTSVTNVESYGNFNTISDRRLKNNITDNAIGLNFIKAVRPVQYELKSQTGIVYDGFVAQEIDSIMQKQGIKNFSGLSRPQNAENTEGGYFTVSYSTFVVPLVNAVKELDAKHEKVVDENTHLKAELDRIKAENATLKANIDRNSKDIESIKAQLGIKN